MTDKEYKKAKKDNLKILIGFIILIVILIPLGIQMLNNLFYFGMYNLGI